MSAMGNILVFLRSAIPDWISIPVANTLIVSSTIILLIGLEQFVKKKGYQLQNHILLLVFLLVHSYFTFVEPNLNARIINLSCAYVLVSFQIAFLMLKRAPASMRKITNPVGYVFVGVFTIQFFRIIYLLQNNQKLTDYFKSEAIESLFILTWEIIIISLTYSIFLMYNKQLVIDVNAQEEKFSKAFHAAPFVIMLSKFSDGKIFEVNKNVQSIFGYHPNELIGIKSIDLGIWEHNSDRLKFISDLLSNRIVIEDEYLFRKKSGELFPGLVTAEIISINNEQSIISVINDITNRKQAELKLKNSEASLRELNSTKDKFFSIIAHDLKSPFNGIMGFSEVLSDQVKNNNYEGIEKYAEIINTSSQHAMDLLTNLMEWSRVQTGLIKFNPEYIDVVPMIKSITELLKSASEHKSITISLNSSINFILYADKEMIEVVLRNLISNAIKFTPYKGAINITTVEKENEYVISVVDNGIGIENNVLENLFRIDNSHSTLGTNNERGTGLGLILCNDFIAKHKGKIWVESELDVGSTFYFSLPKN
ncbi:ATP-binding protein [Labilibaculum sp.]|uniref:sensor histidine kinase n=1 Tax=Labilibaculum sp. TaxID=2060723 RepID=UPI0035628A70